MGPELLRDAGAVTLLVMLATAVILYLRDRVKRLETELKEAQAQLTAELKARSRDSELFVKTLERLRSKHSETPRSF